MESENLEKIVLSELINLDYPEIFMDAIILIEKIKFENQDYQQIFGAIRTLALQNKEIDLISLMNNCPNIDLSVMRPLLMGEVVNPSLFLAHIEYLRDRDYKKEMLGRINKSLKLIKTGQSAIDLDEVKNGLIADLSTLTKDDKAEFENISEYKKQIEEQIKSNKEIEGFSWGITDLDKWTSGIVLPRVYVIGGLKKSGKTRFLIHTIRQLHEQQIPVVFQSMEMPAYEVTKLLHASFTGLNDMRFRSSSTLKYEELQAFKEVEIDQRLLGLECKAGLKLDQLLSRIRRYARMGFKIVFIDYLQRIVHDRNKQAQELEDISIKLADSARQNNIALILLSQLNALGERETPNMGHLKGCVEENTLIDGVPIKEYYPNKTDTAISSFDTNTKVRMNKKPSKVIDSGMKECFEITTKSGKKIIVSGTTKLYTDKEKWQDLADIAVGEKIVVDMIEKKKDSFLLDGIVSIKSVGKRQTYDFTVPETNCFFANGVLCHNSGGIGEAADVIFLFDNLYRRTKKDNDKNKIDIYIEQRHGDSGLIHLWSDLGSCNFKNLADHNITEEGGIKY